MTLINYLKNSFLVPRGYYQLFDTPVSGDDMVFKNKVSFHILGRRRVDNKIKAYEG